MSKFYLQVQDDNVITDAITYPHGNYVECEVNHLPQGILGGWYKYENGVIVEYPELKPLNQNEELAKLKQQVQEQQDALIELATMLSEVVTNG